jgi:hypothetical protein
MAKIRHAMMEQAHIPNYLRKAEALAVKLAVMRATAWYANASPAQQAEAERPLMEEKAALDDSLLRTGLGYIAAERTKLFATESRTVDLKAAIAEPGRAAAVFQLAQCGPGEARRLAEGLVATGDRAGCYGLRQAVARSPELAGAAGAAVVELLNAPTAEGAARLRTYLAAKRSYARALLVAGADPIKSLAACHDSNLIEASDGSTRSLSDSAADRLLDDSGA